MNEEHKWITITEKLPKPFKKVLITNDDGITTMNAVMADSDLGKIWVNLDDNCAYLLEKYNKWADE